VSFREKDARVLPDMSAKVAFLSREPRPDERRPVTAVRPEAVAKRDGRNVAFRLDKSNVVHAIPVGDAPKVGDLVQVTGVNPGDKVVLSPTDRVRDGAHVAIAKK